MIATLCLLGGILAPAQTRDLPSAGRGGAWAVSPRLGRTQELVYRGTFHEEARGISVQFQRDYRVGVRALVLDARSQFFDIALLTTLETSPSRGTRPPQGIRVDSLIGSVSLEKVRVDLQGKLHAAPPIPPVPLDGPPALETGMFLELPQGRLASKQTWDQVEVGRPVRTWRVAGSAVINGSTCVKLVGTQHTPDWAHARADRSAWHREDIVWLDTKLGVAQRLERTVQQRDAARVEWTQKSVFRLELESGLNYPPGLVEDRRVEIQQALAFREAAAPMLPTPTRYGPRLTSLLTRINHHLEHSPTTPYRPAILQVKRQVEAARRGEAITPTTPAPTGLVVARLGETAPDFVASAFTSPEPVRLSRVLGKPVVLLFYHPASPRAGEVLGYAARLHQEFGRLATILALSVSDDTRRVLDQRDALKLPFPILHGAGLRLSFEVEATPKFLLLDSAGVVRGSYLGWGDETPKALLEELRTWLAQRGLGDSPGTSSTVPPAPKRNNP